MNYRQGDEAITLSESLGKEVLESRNVDVWRIRGNPIQIVAQVEVKGKHRMSWWLAVSKKRGYGYGKLTLTSPELGTAYSEKATKSDIASVLEDFKTLGWEKTYEKWDFQS